MGAPGRQVGRQANGLIVRCAQTNVQWFNQLLRAGYPRQELRRAREAYELAIERFATVFRASGKPFLAHAVGTASILAELGARPTVVTAGLLHAVYTHGEFGDQARGITPAKRARIRRIVGREVEELVTRFTTFPWHRQAIPLLAQSLATFPPDYREILLMRLANELEDHLDLGVLYCGDVKRRRRLLASRLPVAIEMAKRLGEPRLAASLKRAFERAGSTRIPMALRRIEGDVFCVPSKVRSVAETPHLTKRGDLAQVSEQLEGRSLITPVSFGRR